VLDEAIKLGLGKDHLETLKEIVAESNLSKFDSDEDDALFSKKVYKDKGVLVNVGFNPKASRYYLISLREQELNGKTIHKGKILKSTVNFKEPDFSRVSFKVNFPQHECKEAV